MAEPDYLLSVTTAATGDAVTIHGDRQGLELLREKIDVLLAGLVAGECDHRHLRSDAWAGFELSTSMLESERDAGHRIVHHLEVLAWTPDWKLKHGL